MLWGASLYVPGPEERHHVETPRQALKKTRNRSQNLLTFHPSSKQKKARDKGPCLNQGNDFREMYGVNLEFNSY